MPEKAAIIDYYAIMNLPPTADLYGVENAYARLSGELAEMSANDEACTAALAKLNEAYNVLSRGDLRRKYDGIFLADKRLEQERAAQREVRSVAMKQWAIILTLVGIVAVQGAFLAYIGWDDLTRLAGG